MLRFDRMAEVGSRGNRIDIAATFTLAGQVALSNQIGDDSLRCSLGNVNRLGNVTRSNGRVPMNADQNVGMIREKRPFGLVRRIDGRLFHRSLTEHPMDEYGLAG